MKPSKFVPGEYRKRPIVEALIRAGWRPTLPTGHWECDCVPTLGPPHCHACSETVGHETVWENCKENHQ